MAETPYYKTTGENRGGFESIRWAQPGDDLGIHWTDKEGRDWMLTVRPLTRREKVRRFLSLVWNRACWPYFYLDALLWRWKHRRDPHRSGTDFYSPYFPTKPKDDDG